MKLHSCNYITMFRKTLQNLVNNSKAQHYADIKKIYFQISKHLCFKKILRLCSKKNINSASVYLKPITFDQNCIALHRIGITHKVVSIYFTTSNYVLISFIYICFFLNVSIYIIDLYNLIYI